jgi:Domain of unknown function (DUF305)
MEMVLFSRAFIRKRVISLVTTTSVTATSFALAQDPARTHHVSSGVRYAADRQEDLEQRPLLSASLAAVQTMEDMAIKPTGAVESDFFRMVPHQDAIEMAKTKLEYGPNDQIRRSARRIVSTQRRRITMMEDAEGAGKSSVARSPEQSRVVLPQPRLIGGSISRGEVTMSQ